MIHVDYTHFNPVKHGWVEAAKDWPYSSFHRWVAQGVYSSNWTMLAIIDLLDDGENKF